MKLSQKKAAFCTLGCKLNQSESSFIARDFESSGFDLVSCEESADIYVINTCSVTQKAEKKCRKAIRQIVRKSPNATIAVIGCYAQLKAQEISQIPGVNYILGSDDKFDLLNQLGNSPVNGTPVVINSDIQGITTCEPAFSEGDRTRTLLKIQDGCDYKCTYCTIPLARGKSRNIVISKIVENAKSIIKTGVKEIVLTGVNIGDFGKSTDESFYELLQNLELIEGLPRLRISSIEPNLLTDEIIELVAQSEIILPHFHIPLQSGSDKVLKLMRRRYTRDLFSDRINKITELIPNACIAADLIVGFPAESEYDFNDCYDFINNSNISYLHVFSYSERANTAALNITPIVSPEVRQNRSIKLQKLSLQKRKQFQDQQIGAISNVLIETFNNGFVSGLTPNYIKVTAQGTEKHINQIVKIRLLENNETSMKGAIV